MKLKPYPAYKPSGVEWLGDVPKGWDVRRSDRIIETERRQIPPSKFAGIEVFHYSIPAVQEHGTGILENGDDVASGKQCVTESVVMVSRLNPRKATVCRAEPQGALTIASTEFVALKARKCDLRFLEHLVNTEPFRQRLDSWVQSVTRSHQRVSPEHIYRFWNAWPPPAEQHAIADFLDRETGKIDRLVAKKRELIGKLKEERAALISAAVTGKLPIPKGRDGSPSRPSVGALPGRDAPPGRPHPEDGRLGEPSLPVMPRLKPSGVSWLGDVPEHWEVRRLKDCGTLISGTGFPHEYQGVEGAELPFYKVGDLASAEDNRTMRDSPNTITRETANELRARIVSQGAVIYAKVGAALLLNRRRMTSCPCCIDNNMTAYVPKQRRLSSEWTFYWTSILDFGEYANPGAVPSISEGYQSTLPMLLPPPDEQRAIADFLDRKTGKIDRLATKVEEAIGRLQEYRAALITAAVTGKIDVRNKTSALEYPVAESALLEAAESGARYGGKNTAREHTDKHGRTPACAASGAAGGPTKRAR